VNWKALLLSSSGRCRPQDFWIGFLILFAAGFVLGFIPLINLIAPFAMIYPWVCLYAQRLHDAGRSGWLAAVPWLIQVVAIVAIVLFALDIGFSEGADPSGWYSVLLVGGGAFVAWLAFTLWVGLAPGDPGVNRYGPPPGKADPAGVFS
jgi:uncharacterized membrane protein YhaH (DUF805 family)